MGTTQPLRRIRIIPTRAKLSIPLPHPTRETRLADLPTPPSHPHVIWIPGSASTPHVVGQDFIHIIHLIEHALRRLLIKDELKVSMCAKAGPKVKPCMTSQRLKRLVAFPEIAPLVDRDEEQYGCIQDTDGRDVDFVEPAG